MFRIKKNIIAFSIIATLTVLILAIFFFRSKNTTCVQVKIPNNYLNCNQIKNPTAPINPSEIIRDDNTIHLLHARTNGLKRVFENDLDVDTSVNKLIETYKLVKITSNATYKIKDLKHSHPYLVSEAASMVEEIAVRFKTKLKEKKLGNYSFFLTSVLRTKESQDKLSKRNSNATDTTAHLFATTVDISYKHFYNHQTDSIEPKWEVIQELMKTLLDMRKECKLLAVKERKQSCFHITVVCCKPKEEVNNQTE